MALAVTSIVPLSEYCDGAPAVASLEVNRQNLLFLAWKGKGNRTINIIISNDGGQSFRHKTEFSDQSTIAAPALAANNGTLFIAWTGTDELQSLNIAAVTLGSDPTGAIYVTGLDPNSQHVLDQQSDNAPALASFNGQLVMAWKGNNNNEINFMSSSDGFASTDVLAAPIGDANFADRPLSLAVFNGSLWVAWKGTPPTEFIQFAQVDSTFNFFDQQSLTLSGVPPNLAIQVIVNDPALGSSNPTGPGILFTAFEASFNGSNWLSLSAFIEDDEWLFPNYSGYATDNAPAVTWFEGQFFLAWPEQNTQKIITGRTNIVAPR